MSSIKLDGLTLASTANSAITIDNVTLGDSISFSQGTWTPTFTDNAGNDLVTTYGARKATYTRIGNIVFFNCDIENNSYSSSSTSQLYLSGLPTFGVSFGQSNVEYNGYYGGIVSYYAGLQSYSASYSIHWILQNTGRISFYYAGGANSNAFQQNYLTSSSRFILEGRYYLEAIT